ncbi:hypothetical protein MNV49_002711 [Pseudohyphozyma bogoriensis]|nr:hypothetical protein MNV49_002711 [Pseudohyphozyma bogoriensis]
MTFFSKSSITFVAINLLRFLSIVAIGLALSGEIAVMVSSKTSSTSASTSRLVRRSDTIPLALYPVLVEREPTSSTAALESTATTTTRKAAATATSTQAAAAAATSSLNSSTSAVQSLSASNCAYIGSTSIPKEVGGVVFATLNRIFSVIILLFMLVSEMPPPTTFVERFWHYAFPPLGENFGVGVLGVLQTFIGSSLLSHSVSGLPQVGGWFLFIVGLLNILFGLAFSSSIKSLRSITPSRTTTDGSTTGLKSLGLASHASPMAGHHAWDEERMAPSAVYMGQGPSGGGVKGLFGGSKRPIHISPPMQQTAGAPPVYPSQ